MGILHFAHLLHDRIAAMLRYAPALLLASALFAQADPTSRSWNQPVEPFRIAGNLHYVGANEITSFLITTPRGHILLDSGFKETVPQILQNVSKLGFRPEDIEILLNSQAHYDHAAGFALLKKLTGAKLHASRADALQLERGGRGDFAFGDRFPFDPVMVDRRFDDGASISLGGSTLRAVITAGHTKGCTSWTMQLRDGDRIDDVVFVCSVTAPGYQLLGNPGYPEIVEDFRRSFQILGSMKPTIFLASHGNFFQLTEKRKKLAEGASVNPFRNSEEFRKYVEASREQFEKQLAAEKAGEGRR